MKKFESAAQLMEYMEENYGHYGLRGISQFDLEKQYQEGDYMDYSFDLCDRRDCEFDEEAAALNGTCAIGVNDQMFEADLEKAYTDAHKYAVSQHGTGIVYLVSGERESYGEDQAEVILNNDDMWDSLGAKVVGIVEF